MNSGLWRGYLGITVVQMLCNGAKHRPELVVPAGIDADVAAAVSTPVLDVVIPIYNEQTDLAPSVRRLHRYVTPRRIGSSRNQGRPTT